MNKITKPSLKSQHRVFLNKEEDNCILEVKRTDKFFIYEIDNFGKSSLLGSSLYPYFDKLNKEEVYYLDYLTAETLHKIDALTSNYDYNEIINGFKKIVVKLTDHAYSFAEFNMEDAYLLEDYKDVLCQLFEFTNDNEYNERLIYITKFFNEYFYEVQQELSIEQLDLMKKTLNSEILFLEKNQSN